MEEFTEEKEILKHIGHRISILKQEDFIIEVKCLDCNKVLLRNADILEERGIDA